MKIFESDRKFKLITYSGAMLGALVFHSRRTNATEAKIELLFSDVRALELRAFCEGLVVEIDDGNDASNLSAKLGPILEPGLYIYLLSTKEWKGYIVGGAFYHEETKLVFTNHKLDK